MGLQVKVMEGGIDQRSNGNLQPTVQSNFYEMLFVVKKKYLI